LLPPARALLITQHAIAYKGQPRIGEPCGERYVLFVDVTRA
jgi:hypothetical protein